MLFDIQQFADIAQVAQLPGLEEAGIASARAVLGDEIDERIVGTHSEHRRSLLASKAAALLCACA